MLHAAEAIVSRKRLKAGSVRTAYAGVERNNAMGPDVPRKSNGSRAVRTHVNKQLTQHKLSGNGWPIQIQHGLWRIAPDRQAIEQIQQSVSCVVHR